MQKESPALALIQVLAARAPAAAPLPAVPPPLAPRPRAEPVRRAQTCRGQTAAGRPELAGGETVILLTPRLHPLMKCLMEEEGGAAE